MPVFPLDVAAARDPPDCSSPQWNFTEGKPSPLTRNRANITQHCYASFPLLMELAGCNNNLNFTPQWPGQDEEAEKGHKLAVLCPLINEGTIQDLLICHSQQVIKAALRGRGSKRKHGKRSAQAPVHKSTTLLLTSMMTHR
ncbi:uncharacterized [Tachysurus ichikawai]